MTLTDALVIALVQGATEFLPVSSKSHQVLVAKVLGLHHDLPLDFLITVHLGTLLAVVVYYWGDLRVLVGSVFRRTPTEPEALAQVRENRRLLALLLLATVPAGVCGALFSEGIERALNSTLLLGVGLIGTALILAAASRLDGTRDAAQTGWQQALFIGCAQALALLPGISRSGTTIAGGLACGLKREWAPRFAFLLSVPTILGGFLFKLGDLARGQGSADFNLATYSVAAVVAALSGYVAIKLVTDSVRRGNLLYFAAYCLGVGLVALMAGLGP